MASTREKIARAEHMAHAPTKHIGLTMALIGVLIAFCAAMVGSERNELTRTMIDQTQAHSDYGSASTKFRIVMIELEKLRGQSSPESIGAAPIPALKRFLRLYLDYSKERAFAKTWVDTYQPAVEAHFDASESYEKAQLVLRDWNRYRIVGGLAFQPDSLGDLDYSRAGLYRHAGGDIHEDAPHGCADNGGRSKG